MSKEKTLKYLNEYSSDKVKVQNNDEEKVKFNDLNTTQIIKISSFNSTTIENANKILNNQIVVFSSLDVLDFSEGINWDYTHHTNPGTYQLYLQALNCISILLNAYEKSNDLKYLIKAQEIIESWIKYEETNPENTMVWYDHPTAYRAHNLVYFLILAKRHLNINIEKYVSLIERHATFLYKDDHYRKNNHGIMMDRALILLGNSISHPEASRWIEKGIWRLKDTFYSSYSYNGVHLENSPEYHTIVYNLYKSTESFLNKNNLSLGEDVLNILSKSEKYFAYLAKPDLSLPQIGDTGKAKAKIEKRFDSFHDQVAGISVLQSENKKDPKLSTWISFVSGYGTVTHKHNDDLSITLFYNGKDIFMDTGKYGYGNSPIRGYVLSPEAHTTVHLKGKKYKYDLTMDDMKKIYTKSFYTSEKLDIVSGVNGGYDNLSLERTLVFIKPDILIILDRAKSEGLKNIVQTFNLAPHIEIGKEEKNKILLYSENDEIELEQFNTIDSLDIREGSIDPPVAIIAEKFGSVIPTRQLQYNKKMKTGNFLTVVKLGKNAIDSFKKVELDEANNLMKIELRETVLQFYI
ncbi:hypothetical protein EC501_01230 [Lysinibacillus halotolerans]|uniref:Uncharacterized protein n=2 Tax=Lysinibacillus halotolerans TaxID=1368476 RepID=A0A3M8HHQ7_9BACI|nr:hypothetical protein EC501_01230 [Lysinibacillus halotolerans]